MIEAARALTLSARRCNFGARHGDFFFSGNARYYNNLIPVLNEMPFLQM